MHFNLHFNFHLRVGGPVCSGAVFKKGYDSLEEYLTGFMYTTGVSEDRPHRVLPATCFPHVLLPQS